MWRRVAAALAKNFTIVCADLRGYGASGKAASKPDHSPYSKRVMALDMVRLMALRFAHFSVVGHDRGARVAYRMALDHPSRIDRLAVLDVIPTAEAFRGADAWFALAFWPSSPPETAQGGFRCNTAQLRLRRDGAERLPLSAMA